MMIGPPARPGSRLRLQRPWSLAVVMALVLLGLPMTPDGVAQEESRFRLELAGLPLSHRVGDPLDLKVRVINGGETELAGFRLIVGAYDRVDNRSTLHESIDLSSTEPSSSFLVPFEGARDSLSPHESRVVTIRDPVSSLAVIALTGSPGVYPVKITLQTPSGAPLDSVTTQLLLYPRPQDNRLSIVPVLPLNAAPNRDPYGVFDVRPGGPFSLEPALSDGGWLTELLDRLAGFGAGRKTRIALGIAPTPRLIEEIADMADGYSRNDGTSVESVSSDDPSAQAAARWLDRFLGVLSRPWVQPILVPYAAPDLPSIATSDQLGSISTQVNAGRATLKSTLGVSFDPAWLFPPAGRLDSSSLQQTGAEHTFFSESSLDQPSDPGVAGCPVKTLSFACPVSVSTPLGEVTGFESEPELQRLLGSLTRPGDTPVELQRFFAETAMIREELPGRTDRVLQITLPSASLTGSGPIERLLIGLARAPWLETLTPEEGLSVGRKLKREIVSRAPEESGRAPDDYYRAIQLARAVVEDFGSIKPPDDLVGRLKENILVAQSRAWWADQRIGAEYAAESRVEAETELSKVGIVARDTITLTSSRGAVQLAVFNDTGYRVEVDVALFSEQLPSLPNLPPIIVDTAQKPVQFEIRTQASGIFPLRVQLMTPSGAPIGEPKVITVRSTEFNEIALGITVGALIFLVLFYVVRWTRKGRSRAPGRRLEERA